VTKNIDPIIISDESSSISAARGESYVGAGPPAAGPSSISAARGESYAGAGPPAADPSSISAARGESYAASPSSIITDTNIAEGRVLQLRYIYQLSMEQRTRLIIKEIMQGT